MKKQSLRSSRAYNERQKLASAHFARTPHHHKISKPESHSIILKAISALISMFGFRRQKRF